MDRTQFGEELKKHRLARQVSLNDISAETRINIRFLEAIERGDLHMLPQTYVRAFLREYALVVGLTSEEVMRMYDETAGTRTAASPSPAILSGSSFSAEEPSVLSRFTPRQQFIGAAIAFLVFVIVALFLLRGNNAEGTSRPPAEISFDHVVRETEAAAARPAPPPVAAPKPVAFNDSLRLDIVTTDSLWLSILVDGRSEEYLFPPNRTRHWMAKDKFVITMGNAGGATFRLNGKEIGALGRRGAVIRNTPISAATLKVIPPPGSTPP